MNRPYFPTFANSSARHPEMVGLEAWELAWPLFALGYCDGLVDEGEIAAVLEALRIEGDVLP